MGKKRKGENIVCKACDKVFYVPSYRVNTAKFCSLICQNHKQYERPKFKCCNCNKIFEASPSREGKRKYCSRTCKTDFEIDRKNCIKKKRRESIKEARLKGIVGNSGAALRKWVLENKENKCEICDFDEYICCLDIHHKDNNPNNNDIKNLIILCVMCHRKVHRGIIKL